MLIAIIIATWYAMNNGIVNNWFTQSLTIHNTLFKLDLLWLFQNIKFLPSLLVFFLIDFYGSIWKFIGLTSSIPDLREKTNNSIEKAMYVDGYATAWWTGISDFYCLHTGKWGGAIADFRYTHVGILLNS